jgi:hypothetical protein
MGSGPHFRGCSGAAPILRKCAIAKCPATGHFCYLGPQWSHSFGPKSVSMLGKLQNILLPGRKLSGAQGQGNFGGALMPHSALPLR